MEKHTEKYNLSALDQLAQDLATEHGEIFDDQPFGETKVRRIFAVLADGQQIYLDWIRPEQWEVVTVHSHREEEDRVFDSSGMIDMQRTTEGLFDGGREVHRKGRMIAMHVLENVRDHLEVN